MPERKPNTVHRNGVSSNFSDGITGDIITALSRSRDLFVIEPSFRVRLQGQVNRGRGGEPRTESEVRAGGRSAEGGRPTAGHGSVSGCDHRRGTVGRALRAPAARHLFGAGRAREENRNHDGPPAG